MGYLTYQINDEACSLACFQMLLVNRTGKNRYKRAKLPLHPPFSLLDLEEGARRYGHKLAFYDAGNEHIGYPFNEKQPFLAVMGEQKNGHMVYIRKISKRFVYVFDPARGKKRYEKKEFEELFSGIFGVLEKDVYEEEGATFAPPFMSWWLSFFICFLTVISELALLVGFYFFSKEGNILLPMLSFIAFGLSSLASRMFMMKVSKKLDKRYLERTYDEDKGKMEESYRRYYFYKRHLLADVPNAISSLIGALILTFLVSFNNPFFLLPVAFSIFLCLFSAFFFKRRFEGKRDDLERLERAVKEESDKEKSISSLQEIGDISSSLSRDIEYERIVIAVGLLSSNLLSLLFQNEVTLNFYLFHLFALFGIYLLFKKTLEPLFNKKDFLVARGHYVEYLSSPANQAMK